MQKHNWSINKIGDSDPYATNEHLNELPAHGHMHAGADNELHKRAIKDYSSIVQVPE